MEADAHIDDNVIGMQQEEEGQRQGLILVDEKPQQEEDGEENEVDDDEEEDESDEVEVSDDDDDDQLCDEDKVWKREFKLACRKIERNDPSFRAYHCTPSSENCFLTDDGALSLGKALLGNTELTELSICFREDAPSLTPRCARALVAGISGSHIRHLSLEGSQELPLEMAQLWGLRSMWKISLHVPMGNEFAIQLCECLTTNKLLRHFSVDVDKMTPRVAQIFSKFIRRSPMNITGLTFIAPWGIADTSTLALQTFYSEGVHRCQRIQRLSFDGNLGDMHALIPMPPKLHRLSITHIDLSLLEMELLTKGLSNANRLHTLCLEACWLHPEHMKVLSPILGNHQSIQGVILNNNVLKDAGIASFVQHWKQTSKIEKLGFYGNDIGPKGAVLLIKASADHSTLTLLDLTFNRPVGLDGLKLMSEVLPNAKIQMLGLRDMVEWIDYNDFHCDAAVLQRSKRIATGKALLEGVRGNRHLLEVKLESSYVPTNVVEEINFYVKANAQGRQAVLENQHILPCGVWSHFFAKEAMSSSMMFLFLRELPSVVMGGSRNSSLIGRKRCRAV